MLTSYFGIILIYLQECENFNDFAFIDNDVAVCENFIGPHSQTHNDDDNDNDLDNEDEPVPREPSREEIFAALDVLKDYAATSNISASLFESINKVTFECANNLTTIVYKQTNIKNYFKRQ